MPERIDQYEVLDELGRGGMGVVYKVRHSDTGELLALKMLPPEALARADSALRFKREFRAMKRVQHPNVIRVHEAGTHENCPYFTMEIVEGKDVRVWLDDGPPIVPPDGPPPPGKLSTTQRARLNDPTRVRRLADVINQVGFALGAIHGDRIVHRDLKPDNILVNKAGVVKLMDFGIAKRLTGHSEQSSGGMVVGTFKYLSPEQALGAEVDGRADLYCLGIILYELLAGRHPFYSENSVGYAYHHARKPPPDIERFNPEVHQGLKAVCERLIRKTPAERYATAEDVIAAVRDALESSEPQQQSAADAVKPANVFTPGLVGRNSPMRVLSGLAQDIASHRGGIIAIGGRPGFGKSRLLQELGPVGREHGVDVHVGEAQEDGAPYAPYVEVLDRIIDDLAASHPQEVQKLLGREAPVLGRYLSSIERLGTGARPQAAGKLDPTEEKLRFIKAVEAFLSRLALIRPRIICIDDMHLADELTLELTQHLAKTLVPLSVESKKGKGAPISLVVTIDSTRKDKKNARRLVSKLKKLDGFRSFELKALSPDEVREMMVTMIGGGDVAAPVGAALHEKTAGVPAAVEERIRGWAQSGELLKQGREWVLLKRAPKSTTVATPNEGETASIVDAEPEDPPSQVVELKTATKADIPIPDFEDRPEDKLLKSLSPVARDVAERCAVCAARLSEGLAQRVALREEDELLDAIDELLGADVLKEDDDGELRFSLKARSALLAGLPRERRQRLHQVAAQSLEEDARRRRQKVDLELLAKHHLEGGEPAKALQRMLQAARAALEASATQSAAELVQKARELFQREFLETSTTQSQRLRADLVMLRLDVLASAGEHRECVALARRRLEDLGHHLDTTRRAELLLRLSDNERAVGELDDGLEHARQVLALTERGGLRHLRCQAKNLCGMIYARRGEFSLSDRYFQEALELARTVGHANEAEIARAALARRRLETGDLAHARKSFRALADDAKKHGQQLAYCRYLTTLGIIAEEQCRFDDADKALLKALKLGKSASDRRGMGGALLHFGSLRLHQQKFDDCRTMLSKAERIFDDLAAPGATSQVQLVMCRLALDEGTPKEAARLAQSAFTLAEKAGSAVRLAEASIIEGYADELLGEDGSAAIERGLTAAQDLDSLRVSLLGLRARAYAKQRAGDVAGAKADLHDGMVRARAVGARLQLKLLEQAAQELG